MAVKGRKTIINMQETLAIGIREAANALGLSHWTIRQWIRQGRLRAVRLGRRRMIEPAELERLMRLGRMGAQR
jgi:excisionase family DNA binding protein